MGHTFLTIFALIGCTSCLVVHENVVFHKTNEVSLNHARWLVTFIHDLRPFEVFINKISKDLESSNEIMLTLTEWYRQHNFTTYHSTFKSLNDEIGLLNDTYKTVKDNFVDYQTLQSDHERSKRSLLPIVGQAMSLLFGTVSDLDLEMIQRSVHDLAANQESIIHNLEQSMTPLNLSRIQIAENRRAIMDLVECVMNLDDKIKELATYTTTHFVRLEQFVNTYFQFKLILEEIRQSTQNAFIYIENLRTELNMLSLSHLSPSTISPKNLRALLLDVKDKLPVSMQLPADPESNIWYFYNTLTCTAYLDGHKILIVLTIPLLDRKEIYEIYKIHNLPLPKNQKLTSETKTLNAVAKYDISAEALMINEDRTKYTLLSGKDYYACNNRYMPFCNPKSPIYQINLSKSCVIALFLKNKENVQRDCKSMVYLNSRLPIAEYVHSGVWIVATSDVMKFTIVCQDRSGMQGEVVVHPPLGVIRLNMTCGAANDYLSLPPYYEKKVRGHIWDAWGSLLKLRNITHFSLWENFTSNFPNLTTIEISSDLMNLREIAMPAFIDYVHNYRKVDEHGGSISNWSFVVMIFGTCVFILILIFMYKKCFHEKVKVYFGERLADCCGNNNVVTSSLSVVENGLVSSEHDEIVRRKSGRQPTSAPDQKEAKVLLASLENMKK